jgi:hypothetical protein
MRYHPRLKKRQAAAPDHLLDLDDDTIVALNEFKQLYITLGAVLEEALDMEDTENALFHVLSGGTAALAKLETAAAELRDLKRRWQKVGL